ncbi:ribonuclease P protein subunit POP4 [Halarchaeum rubridurum]|uniref:Ribonuclease P protein component 1 n=1 Tax=Halarchaeum rubridurum TaxID=489911 RepID=A0A830FT27_9EURY|nr:ribonuclease P protein component 1 [Halarchaeum rubridurum]MBP1953908.1 ribonuclease P protein subunit POP4 [Halarchaeum rubridurum]GGM55763.1 ribonuclease P [Halarchaeum rubridurum]
MTLTPETLPRHELVGLPVRVVDSPDTSQVGIAGTVVSETTNTLVIEVVSGTKRVPKGGRRFEFRLIDEAAARVRRTSDAASTTRRRDRKGAGTASQPDSRGGATGEDAAYVTVDGDILLSRPALRSENGVESQWR